MSITICVLFAAIIKCSTSETNLNAFTKAKGSDRSLLQTMTSEDVNSATSISCGASDSGTYGTSPVYWVFNNPQRQGVIFSNCKTAFDPNLYVYDSTLEWISESVCGGDDCYMGNGCITNNREEFIMTLDAGTYYIELYPYSSGSGQTYALSLTCTTPESTTKEPTAAPVTAMPQHLSCGSRMQTTVQAGNVLPHYYLFNLYEPKKVRFQDCETEFDPNLFVYDRNTMEELNSEVCDGDDCGDCSEYPNVSGAKENYVLNLNPGEYMVMIRKCCSDSADATDQEYVLGITCTDATSSPTTPLPSAEPTPLPSAEPTTEMPSRPPTTAMPTTKRPSRSPITKTPTTEPTTATPTGPPTTAMPTTKRPSRSPTTKTPTTEPTTATDVNYSINSGNKDESNNKSFAFIQTDTLITIVLSLILSTCIVGFGTVITIQCKKQNKKDSERDIDDATNAHIETKNTDTIQPPPLEEGGGNSGGPTGGGGYGGYGGPMGGMCGMGRPIGPSGFGRPMQQFPGPIQIIEMPYGMVNPLAIQQQQQLAAQQPAQLAQQYIPQQPQQFIPVQPIPQQPQYQQPMQPQEPLPAYGQPQPYQTPQQPMQPQPQPQPASGMTNPQQQQLATQQMSSIQSQAAHQRSQSMGQIQQSHPAQSMQSGPQSASVYAIKV